MITPLVKIVSDAPIGSPEVGNLITWVDYAGRELGGRLERLEYGSAWIKVIGLSVERPYEIGQIIVRPQDAIIDWSR